MAASPSTVLTAGFGPWGGINLLVTRGFGVDTAVLPVGAVLEAAAAVQPWIGAVQASQPWLAAEQT